MADLNYVIDPVTHTVTVDVDSNRIVIPPTDTTLTVLGKAADAKATGDAIGEVVSYVVSLDGSKVDKVPGKGLSAQDFTTTLKNKLDGIEQGATKTTVDSSLSSSSTNPVQNKVIKAALDGKQATEAGKGLSTEDFTTTLKNKLDGIEQGANKTEIVNNTTTDDSAKALSAAQGKALDEAKVNISDIQNNLTSTATNKPLSAAQGKNLSETKANKSDVVPNTQYRITNLDDVSSYPSGEHKVYHGYFDSSSSGTKPFTDGHVDTYVWRNNIGGTANFITQIAYEDSGYNMCMRTYHTSWSEWGKIVIFEQGTWTAHIYDYETKLFEVGNQTYYKIGSIYIMTLNISAFPATTLSTMLQVRNLPCNNMVGGNLYLAGGPNQGMSTIQGFVGARVYPRPNIKGAVNAGICTGLFIGI